MARELQILFFQSFTLNLVVANFDLKVEQLLLLLIQLFDRNQPLCSHFLGLSFCFFDTFFENKVLLLAAIVSPMATSSDSIKICMFLLFEALFEEGVGLLQLILSFFQGVNFFVEGPLDHDGVVLEIFDLEVEPVSLHLDLLVLVLETGDPLLQFLEL